MSANDNKHDFDSGDIFLAEQPNRPGIADAQNESENATVEFDISKLSRSAEEKLAETNIFGAAPVVSEPSPEENTFLDSVMKYRVRFTSEMQREQNKKRLVPLLASSVMLVICLSIFLYSSYLIVSRTAEKINAEKEYEDIRVDKFAESPVKKPAQMKTPTGMLTLFEGMSSGGGSSEVVPPPEVTVDEMQEFKDYYANYMIQRRKYPQMFGWIVLTGTKIDYPLMLDPNDNYYYLNYSYSGQPSRSGSCYADSRTLKNYFKNYNLVTYGHCMNNGTMYRGIKTWYDSATRDADAENMRIYVYNPDGVYIYEIFSSYRSTDSSTYAKTDFYSDSEYYAWLKKIYRRSSLRKECEFSSDSRIITMITCSNVVNNPEERYVLHGKLINMIPASELTD